MNYALYSFLNYFVSDSRFFLGDVRDMLNLEVSSQPRSRWLGPKCSKQIRFRETVSSETILATA